jgi:sugar transferase EpsL
VPATYLSFAFAAIRSACYALPATLRRMTFTQRLSKRILDLAAALALLAVTCVPMAVIAVLVRIFLGRPVLFVQQRPGLHGRPFEIMKFRSMNDRRGSDGELLPDTERLTRFGRWLRRSSLDELPQLFNVLRGELSLVGPRPLLMQYLPLYSPQQARRHEVQPGITGWAQVNGRNAITWEEKLALDVWYVDHQSIFLDLRILLLTLGRLFRKDDVEGYGNVPFTGSPDRKTED